MKVITTVSFTQRNDIILLLTIAVGRQDLKLKFAVQPFLHDRVTKMQILSFEGNWTRKGFRNQ